MKIMQINSVRGFGSTGRIATDLEEVLKDNGHESLIAFGRGSAPDNPDSFKIGTKFDSYVQVLQTRLFDRHGYGSINATKSLIERIKSFSPDIVHLHNIHGYYVNVLILFDFLKEYNRPVVWTLHDCWSFTGHCAHFDYVGCEKWRDGCFKCPQKKMYPSSKVMDNSKKNYKLKQEIFTSIENMVIVTPSNWLAKLVEQSYLSKYQVKVINNGIDLNVFKYKENDLKKEYNIGGKKIVLGVASVWDERKGLSTFIKLAEKLPEGNQIILIGLNEKQVKKLPNNIIGISRTNNIQELVNFYSVADVFVNPTYEDNFPTTNIEALACGTPVVTYKTGGSVEALDDLSGFIVEQGNIEQLVRTIEKIEEKTNVNIDCINRSKKFDKNKRYNDYLNLYETLIKNSNTASHMD